MNTVDCQTEKPSEYPVSLQVRSHAFRGDVAVADGSTDSAPSPHDYFDAALASCKALTAMWFAKRNAIPLERVETHVERDATEERKGVHKLMTTSDVQVETVA